MKTVTEFTLSDGSRIFIVNDQVIALKEAGVFVDIYVQGASFRVKDKLESVKQRLTTA